MFWLNFTSIRLHEGIQAGSGLDVKKAVDSKHNLCDERRRRQLEREVEAMTKRNPHQHAGYVVEI